MTIDKKQMKVLFSLLMLLGLTIYGCGDNYPTKFIFGNKTADSIKRYCLSIDFNPITTVEAHKFIKSPGYRRIKELFKDEGVRTFSTYTLGDHMFVIMDTNMSFDFEKAMTEISKKKSYRGFVTVNEGRGLELIDRIYELDQKVDYKAIDGQVKPKPTKAQERIVMTLSLVDDKALIEEYKTLHAKGKAWPQITENMKSIGIYDMEIYLHKNQAFLIMDVKPGFNLDEVGSKWQNLPKEKEWQDVVSKFQAIDPNSDIADKWRVMNKEL